MKFLKNRRWSVLLLSAAWPATGWAQAAPAPIAPAAALDSESGEIVVTAQKRRERLSDVPLSITAVSGAQLAKQQITTIADLERIAPGFTYSVAQSGTPIFQIRGVGFYNEAAAVSPTVSVYVDQVPLPFSRLAEGAPLDAERVEVLKGPQGTLFGQNATGGAINYIAAKPTDVFHAGMSVAYGSFNDIDGSAYLSGPISETLTARLAVHGEHRDGWQQSLTRDDTSGARRFFDGRLLVDWKPSDRFTLELNINGWRDLSDTQQGQARRYLPVAPGAPLTPETIATAAALIGYPYLKGNSNRLADWDAGRNYRRDDGFWQVAASANYTLNDDMHLVSLSSYGRAKMLSPFDFDGTNVPGAYGVQDVLIKTFNQELRVEGDMDRLKWVLGGNYGHDIANEDQVVDFRGSNAQIPLSPVFAIPIDGDRLINHQTVNTYAAFGNVDFKLSKAFSVQGGVRYTDERRRFAGCLADQPDVGVGLGAFGLLIPNFVRGQCITQLPDGSHGVYHSELHQNNVSWRVGLNYKVDPDTLLYANVTKGNKSGAFGTLPAASYQQLIPVSQESVLAYEAGFKMSDHQIDISGAAFYYDYRNKQTQGQVLIPPFGNLPNLINIPKARIYGFEGNVLLRPMPGLRTSLGVTYVDSKITGSALTASPYSFDPVDAKGQELPLSPKWQVVADGEYDFALSSGTNAFIGSSLTYRSRAFGLLNALTGPAGTQGDFVIKRYALLDLRAGVEFRRYRVSVFGHNVTNTVYWNDVTKVYDTVVRLTGQPATYGISLSVNW